MDRDDLGFLLAKATQRWNELLQERFRAAGWSAVRPSYGSILVPLFKEDGLRMGELARRARMSKQTMTTMVRLLEREGLVRREPAVDMSNTSIRLQDFYGSDGTGTRDLRRDRPVSSLRGWAGIGR
jgi:hypothetical protein